VTIGGEAIAVAFPNFVLMEAAWPFISQATTRPADPAEPFNPMRSVRAVLGVVAVGTCSPDAPESDLTPEALAPMVESLARKLKPTEVGAVRGFLNELMVELGLAAAPGEKPPAGEGASDESPSPATSTDSSSKS
jgi:hypothetical protein